MARSKPDCGGWNKKHSEARQASDDYDQQADDRLVKAAYDFNIQFASQFSAAYGTSVNGHTHPSRPWAPREDLDGRTRCGIVCRLCPCTPHPRAAFRFPFRFPLRFP